jgi:transposase
MFAQALGLNANPAPQRAMGQRIWAVEGSGSLGRGVAQFLAVRGERVHEVNPRWTAQRRRGLRRTGKSDVLDAQAVARLLREEGESLPLVQADTVVRRVRLDQAHHLALACFCSRQFSHAFVA